MATANVLGKLSPFDIHRFTGGHASDWTEITFDSWVRKVAVNNQGTNSLWVARGLTGTRAASDNQVEVKTGTTVDFNVDSFGKLSVFGSDGATHPIGFILEINR